MKREYVLQISLSWQTNLKHVSKFTISLKKVVTGGSSSNAINIRTNTIKLGRNAVLFLKSGQTWPTNYLDDVL